MRYAVVTDHPNKHPRNLLVWSWHETEDDADKGSLRLVMESSATGEGGDQIIAPQLSGLAIVREDLLRQIAPGTWGWAKDIRRQRPGQER
jgi:hypothetical protein